MSFVVIPTAQNRFIGLKKLFFLSMPMPKFWHWRSLFYRIGSRGFFLNDKGHKEISKK
jgi:hypothetical protein